MDVAGWLQGLGLGRYESVFRENDIDGDVLQGLTADDLKDLGVTSIGHRRKLLDAIAALYVNVPPPAAASLAASTPAAAERRQLTVMFCDLVGSTELSSRLDPEDLREVIGAYHRCVADIAGCFDGFVAKYMGDGVLVYFGYPRAHEDDAERAVRAGLALVESIGQLQAREPMRARIGLATGLVVVGDLIGAGAAQEQAVVGETPNLAARLQNLAGPNTVLIDANTRRLVGSLFELHDLGHHDIKGFAGSQPVWRVIGEGHVQSRFEALRSGETPLIGREEEIEFLLRRWSRAEGGNGQVVLISGEPGIGKIAYYRRPCPPAARRAASAPPLLLHGPLPEQRALSGHCPGRARRGVRTRGFARRKDREAQGAACAEFCGRRGHSARQRFVVAAAST